MCMLKLRRAEKGTLQSQLVASLLLAQSPLSRQAPAAAEQQLQTLAEEDISASTDPPACAASRKASDILENVMVVEVLL